MWWIRNVRVISHSILERKVLEPDKRISAFSCCLKLSGGVAAARKKFNQLQHEAKETNLPLQVKEGGGTLKN